jgi:hypothetical protein
MCERRLAKMKEPYASAPAVCSGSSTTDPPTAVSAPSIRLEGRWPNGSGGAGAQANAGRPRAGRQIDAARVGIGAGDHQPAPAQPDQVDAGL